VKRRRLGYPRGADGPWTASPRAHDDKTGSGEPQETSELRRDTAVVTGVCWDNAAAESFFATLKNEMYYRQTFATRARARFAVAEYIEVFYNRRRLHSTLGYRTPFDALNDYRAAATAAA
jgi:transposase InsO family protein